MAQFDEIPGASQIARTFGDNLEKALATPQTTGDPKGILKGVTICISQRLWVHKFNRSIAGKNFLPWLSGLAGNSNGHFLKVAPIMSIVQLSNGRRE